MSSTTKTHVVLCPRCMYVSGEMTPARAERVAEKLLLSGECIPQVMTSQEAEPIYVGWLLDENEEAFW